MPISHVQPVAPSTFCRLSDIQRDLPLLIHACIILIPKLNVSACQASVYLPSMAESMAHTSGTHYRALFPRKGFDPRVHGSDSSMHSWLATPRLPLRRGCSLLRSESSVLGSLSHDKRTEAVIGWLARIFGRPIARCPGPKSERYGWRAGWWPWCSQSLPGVITTSLFPPSAPPSRPQGCRCGGVMGGGGGGARWPIASVSPVPTPTPPWPQVDAGHLVPHIWPSGCRDGLSTHAFR